MHGPVSQLSLRLLRWYRRVRRDLPWRVRIGDSSLPDPYHVLVSETMLQQTQVATVVPYFLRFTEKFPTIAALARADEQDVLRLWQGLGYYSRARNLHAAAKRIVAEHGGVVPSDPDALLDLPGVGRYTAGAIASLAFDIRAPILDGNVARVLCRLDHVDSDPREKVTTQYLWRRAGEILPKKNCGDFNSALMELGATVCTPRAPKCLLCPVRELCEAFARGDQEKIPLPRNRKRTSMHRRVILAIRHRDRYLIEQRPAKGRWAGMWQFVTLDGDVHPQLHPRRHLKLPISTPKHLAQITHALTHRRYTFDVYTATLKRDGHAIAPRRWLTLAELEAYPLPRPHLKVAAMLSARVART